MVWPAESVVNNNYCNGTKYFFIGLIPSYHSIGIWAPILLLLCKLAQGF